MKHHRRSRGSYWGRDKGLNGRKKKSGEKTVKNAKNFFSPEFFLARLDLFPPPPTAPGSPRMRVKRFCRRAIIFFCLCSFECTYVYVKGVFNSVRRIIIGAHYSEDVLLM